VDLADVGVIEGRDRARFLLKASHVAGAQPLDCDQPVQPRVTRLPHLAHSSCADVREDFVRTDTRPGDRDIGISRFYRNRPTSTD